ncbi:error-prone DNA polymerase [Pseudaminobacter sp. 19-2017]|uniref:Error-prone DNA polymerase n=1 Tax=Pseudaminobacter soli (ex Zhang et al. 2022) TaxID=2831468 RepID=A0A942E248_9HYPH|nr:error-prone DNA polymerase [Pseudaminobacter soli]MBS3649778.1 error-prone DNA polymerase [Pseudaminobacter soli]
MNAPVSPAYAEFAVQSNFSFLQGGSAAEDLVKTAADLGYSAIGLADRNTVAGVVRAWKMAEEAGIEYHPGCRLVFWDGTPDLLAYPQDRQGWGNLCRMLTEANLREESEKGIPRLYRSDLLKWGDRLSLAVLADPQVDPEESLSLLTLLRDCFGAAVRLAVAPDFGGDDRFWIEQAAALAEAAGVPLMAVNNVLYHVPECRSLQDVLTAIRLGVTVAEAGYELQANAERHLKPPLDMARLFRGHSHAISETLRFAASLKFSLGELSHNYPDEPTRGGATPQEELERLTWEGAAKRFPGGLDASHWATITKELALVGKLKYAGYFLTVHDIVKFARAQGILCQGRGSAANSLICYCLEITDVGPDRMETLFERFISEERGEPPDIDVDFEHDRRDEVIDYIYKKYSEKHTSLAAAIVTYRSRSAMREVGKALGLSEDTITALASATSRWSSSGLGESEAKSAALDMGHPLTKHLFAHANGIQGFPRHLSQHVGGFVITRDRLDEIVPIMKTAMPERKMIEWDKDDLDAVGLFKVDILALGMLSCLRRCFELLKAHYPEEQATSLAAIPEGETAVYDMICRADTLGVFQIESRAQMSMLPRLKPREFYDLVIEVAIVRPGPIQGDMVHPYLRRREEKEKPEYVKPELEAILKKTLGVPLFQEQAMRIAIVAGGFSPAKADKLRRAMATFRRVGTISKLQDELIEGMVSRDYPRDFAERCFRQIEGFGEYGFPESHAASFALLVYASCWFKTFYPDVFCAAILNSQPMGFYAPAQLVRDAREHGLDMRPVDVNFSAWDCLLEEATFDSTRVAKRHATMRPVIRSRHAVRLGFRQIKGLSEKDMKRLVAQRGQGYASVRDLWLRSGLSASVVERLAAADAFRSLGLDRRRALWEVRALDAGSAAERLPLFERPALQLADNEPETRLPSMPLSEHVIHDYRTLSLSLKAHPVSFLRERLAKECVLPCNALEQIASGRRVSVAGLVLVRQQPGSAKGVIFMTIEDETGIANIIVWKKTFERFRPIVLGARFVRVHGKLQSASGVIHVVAERIEDLTAWLGTLTEEAALLHGPQRQEENQQPAGLGPGKVGSHPRATRLVGKASDAEQDLVALSRRTSTVLPKGRNFQ